MSVRQHGTFVDGVGLAREKSSSRANTRDLRSSLAETKDLRCKRIFDLLLTWIILVTFSPFFLLLMLAIKAGSPGPVFHRQIRLGKEGKPFVLYKFRSMHIGKDNAKHRSYTKHLITADTPYKVDKSGKPLFKIADDSRITRTGKHIRKYGIDEFPQLFNVLRGEMSLIGPRPPLQYEYEQYSEQHRRRLQGIPGITGLWQVSGKHKIPFERMVELDIYYLKNWSIWLDVKIMLKTVLVMFKGDNC